jgi:hypothetical protein
MRQACLPTLLHRRFLQLVLGGVAIFTGSGCPQPYLYYPVAPCPPGTTAPATVQYGSMCDPPTQVVEGATTLSDSPSRSTTVSGAANSSRVVVSRPKDPSPFSWRRSDPDAPIAATTTVEGGLDGPTTNR